METTDNSKRMTAEQHDRYMMNANGEQTYMSGFADPEVDYYKSCKFCSDIAHTAYMQVCGSLKEEHGDKWQYVLMSWGIERMHVIRWRLMPALAIQVNGYEHKGYVIVSLDEGQDLYEVECATTDWMPVEGKRETEVYSDMLGGIIDRMVETGSTTDEEYKAKAQEGFRNLFTL